MADTPENDTMSQDALDAQAASADTGSGDADSTENEDLMDPSELAGEAAEPGLISDEGLISDTVIDSDSSSFDMPSSHPASSPLRMASFDDQPAHPHGGMHSFERVQDIPLELTVELGRTKLLIKDILELGSGSIVELEKMAGEPVDLLANGLLIARGEVVVIEDNFGVRITEVITYADRKALTDNPINMAA